MLEDNTKSDLMFFKKRLIEANRLLTLAYKQLDSYEDFNSHTKLMETLLELLEDKESDLDYYIEKKSRKQKSK